MTFHTLDNHHFLKMQGRIMWISLAQFIRVGEKPITESACEGGYDSFAVIAIQGRSIREQRPVVLKMSPRLEDPRLKLRCQWLLPTQIRRNYK